MPVTIESPTTDDALAESVALHDVVHADDPARWPAPAELQVAMLKGLVPTAAGRRFRPFVARENGALAARAIAVIDARYNAHWGERLGHMVMFEALPGAERASRALVDAVSRWLADEGMNAVRCGFHFACLDFPFVIDAYDTLPPDMLRLNPSYYHTLLKGAGMEVEKGLMDYKIAVTPEHVATWEKAIDGVRRAGYEIIPFGSLPEARRLDDLTRAWNDSYRAHWGVTPLSVEEMALFTGAFGHAGGDDTTVLAYKDGEVVGAVLARPEVSATAVLRDGRTVQDAEKLNVLGIGVCEQARGTGVNVALAGYAYLEMVRRGATHLSYTLVVDDNWPSRRTAEKLGASVCANYVTYGRSIH